MLGWLLDKSSSLSWHFSEGWMNGRGKPTTYTSRQALMYPYQYPDLIPHHCKYINDFLSAPLMCIYIYVYLA